jgi:MFS transporter, MHS family, proline/betaine transporter
MAIDSTIDGSASSVRPGLSRVIIAATIGNVLEGFDFVVYAIAEVFFPAEAVATSIGVGGSTVTASRSNLIA